MIMLTLISGMYDKCCPFLGYKKHKILQLLNQLRQMLMYSDEDGCISGC